MLTKGWNQERAYRLQISLWQSQALGCLAPGWSSKPRGRCRNTVLCWGIRVARTSSAARHSVLSYDQTHSGQTASRACLRQAISLGLLHPPFPYCDSLLVLTPLQYFLSEYTWKPVIITTIFIKEAKTTLGAGSQGCVGNPASLLFR